MGSIALVLLALIAAILLIVLKRFLKWRFSALRKLPGPVAGFLYGVFPQLEREPFMQPQQRWWDDAGPETQLLHYTGILGRHFVMVLDADGVKQILTSSSTAERPRFPKGFIYLQHVIGSGLVTLDGADWHRHRRIIQPSFNTQLIKDVLQSCVPELVDRMMSCWKERPGGDIDIARHFSSLTLDIIGKVAFAHDFNSLESVEQWAKNEKNEVELNSPLVNSLYLSIMPNAPRMLMVNLGLSRLVPYFLPFVHKTDTILNQAVDSVVANVHERYKKERLANKKVSDTTEAKSIMEHLFDSKDTEEGSRNRKLTNHELRDEAKTFLTAGHETTATLCNWAIYCLIKNPHVQKLVLDDINKFAPKDGHITLEDLEKMDYFEAFLNEVLRVYPPVGTIIRSCAEECNILGETIPANTRLVIPISLLQKHHKYWTNPLEFKPERWLKTNETDKKFHHFAYLPFSAGGRNCIGQRFAMLEAKFILAPVIREFEMSLSPLMDGVELQIKSFLTIKSTPSIVMRAKPRASV